ncbi:hypothetical protein BFW38_08755 [Terasakiispira papahanaumokuakeensis]|uniref:Uncharacterized protein n=1 Tax=Terasakiispira papahanaumokuakeensis TaxID=197479 RepID=A0A1E2V9C9_9GAMM|nr:hypothetical protein [Terasakiispira papahanaumokuakeensis]ODC03620.1 hypothetical protein BFW38_08755 [Terasakiispira papahanaumokuakeensis]
MPISIDTQITAPNRSVTFNFDDSVLAYVVGISYWDFSFGSNDHHVKELELSIQANKPTTQQVTAQITAKLNDDSGHGIDSGSSSIHVTCIAVIGSQDANVALVNENRIASGAESPAFPLPSNSLSISASFLSGWDLSQTEDHHVKTFTTAAGFSQSGSNGQITGQAQMVDTSGNFASGWIDGGSLAASTTENGILAKAVTNKQTDSKFGVDFTDELQDKTIKEAAVLLQNLTVTFGGDDHHVKTIGGGCSGWQADGTSVNLDNARAFLTDDSGHKQSNNDSNVSVMVVVTPS